MTNTVWKTVGTKLDQNTLREADERRGNKSMSEWIHSLIEKELSSTPVNRDNQVDIVEPTKEKKYVPLEKPMVTTKKSNLISEEERIKLNKLINEMNQFQQHRV